MLKSEIIDHVIAIAVGYVNDPDDSGGETNHGITSKVARAFGYNGLMENLPRHLAFQIYEQQNWAKLRLDEVCDLERQFAGVHNEIAAELFDTAVNMGTGRAGEFLQTSLNLLTTEADLKVDGGIGPATLARLENYLGDRGLNGVLVLVRMLNTCQGAFYMSLSERRSKDEKFIFGWFLNRVSFKTEYRGR